MPLVDEPEFTLDLKLMETLAEDFSVNSGLILDKQGNSWMLWRCDELEGWWQVFEEKMDSPMGRKLANSACDEEENLLESEDFNIRGFFKRKKKLSAIKKRWATHGWGNPVVTPASFTTPTLNPIVAGFMQAQLEKIDNRRYKMRWEQKKFSACTLSLESYSGFIPPAKKIGKRYPRSIPYKIEIETGWKIDGVSHHLLPSGLFLRLQESCSGLTANVDSDERECWPKVSEGFLSMAIASKKIFIAGEELFLAADVDDWIDNCKNLLGSRGLGAPDSIQSLDDYGGVELRFSHIPIPSIAIGMLAGMWVRCEGKPVKVGVKFLEEATIITLTSRYNLSTK